MSVQLVATDSERALEIRDYLLPLVRKHGTIQVQSGAVRVTKFSVEPWCLDYWTPFNDLSAEEAASPAYRHALDRQRSLPGLPYGLDVWNGEKVLTVQWADTGRFIVTTFIRGAWETDALALSVPPQEQSLPM